MKRIVLSLFFIISINVYAQEWSTVRGTGINYYSSSALFDSVNLTAYPVVPIGVKNKISNSNGDTIFYHNPIVYPNPIKNWSFGCMLQNHTSYVGQFTIRMTNGWEKIVNIFHDTLYINTCATLNTEWIFYKYSNGATVKAKLVSDTLVSFYGLTDSLKSIELTYYDSTGIIKSKSFSGMQLSWTKDHGWYETDYLLSFPKSYFYPNQDFTPSPVQLIGQTVPYKGMYINTSSAVRNYEAGDEWHYTSSINNAPSKRTIMRVENKFPFAYGNVYLFRKQEIGITAVAPVGEYHLDTIYYDTVYYNGNDLLNSVNTRVSISRFASGSDLFKFTSTGICQFSSTDSCKQFESCNSGSHTYTNSYYLMGVGYFYHTWNMVGTVNNQVKLVYFKKGAEIWGEPFALNSEVFFLGNRYKPFIPDNLLYSRSFTSGKIVSENYSLEVLQTDTLTKAIRYIFKPTKSEAKGCSGVIFDSTSLIGPNLIQTDTGSTFYFNERNQPFHLRYSATEHEFWRVHTYNNGSYLNAYIDSVRFKMYPYRDSIKYIHFQLYSNLEEPILSSFSSQVFTLYRNRGLEEQPAWGFIDTNEFVPTFLHLSGGPYSSIAHTTMKSDTLQWVEDNKVQDRKTYFFRMDKSIEKLSDGMLKREYLLCRRTDSSGIKINFAQQTVIDTIAQIQRFLPYALTDSNYFVRSLGYEGLSQFKNFNSRVSCISFDPYQKEQASFCWEKDTSRFTYHLYFMDDFGTMRTVLGKGGDTALTTYPMFRYRFQWATGVKFASSCLQLDTAMLNVSYHNVRATLPQVNLYPNPSSEKVYFDSDDLVGTLIWQDITGRMIQQFRVSGTVILSTSHLAEGVYLWQFFSSEGRIKSGKWIIAR